MSIRMQVTQYGYPADEYADSLTEAGIGYADNTLTPLSCALTDSARLLLGLPEKRPAKIKCVFPNGLTIVRQYDDIAPEGNPRVDLYMPLGYDPTIPDCGLVSVV